MKRLNILLIAMAISIQAYTYSAIDYNHRVIAKTLQRHGIEDISLLKECKIKNSVAVDRGKYFQVEAQGNNQCKYLYVGRVNACRIEGCSIEKSEGMEEAFEYFDYCILFNAEKTIQQVVIFNYQATHGHEVTAKGWLNQFRGYDGSETLESENNIDAISGATTSVEALLYDVEQRTRFLIRHI